MSCKKIKTESFTCLGKRKEGFLEQENQYYTRESISEIKRIKNGYYCCIHSDKDICEIYMCSGNNIPYYEHSNTIRSYVN